MLDQEIMEAIHTNSKKGKRCKKINKKSTISLVDRLCLFISFLTFMIGLGGLVYVIGIGG